MASNDEVWTPEQQVQELKRRAGAIASSLVEKPSFQPNPDGVIVAMPPKNGTTWVLHICHQIRMQGQEPDFDNQNDVIGLIELLEIAAKTGKKLESLEQPAKPRVFTIHHPYEFVPKGGKIIYCFRDQKDAILSNYHFFNLLVSLRGS